MKKTSKTKDILLFSFLSLIILLIILAMYQRDREWTKLSAMERSLSEQSRDVSSLRGSLNAMEKKLESLKVQSLNNSVSNTNTEKMPKSGGGFSL